MPEDKPPIDTDQDQNPITEVDLNWKAHRAAEYAHAQQTGMIVAGLDVAERTLGTPDTNRGGWVARLRCNRSPEVVETEGGGLSPTLDWLTDQTYNESYHGNCPIAVGSSETEAADRARVVLGGRTDLPSSVTVQKCSASEAAAAVAAIRAILDKKKDEEQRISEADQAIRRLSEVAEGTENEDVGDRTCSSIN